MQSSSSGGSRNSRRPRSRGEGQGGQRNRQSSSRRSGGDRQPRNRESSSAPDEFRPSEAGERRVRRQPSAPVPEPTAFQKFVKLITFGLVDLAPKKAPSRSASAKGSGSDKPREGGSGSTRDRRTPAVTEPTTPRLYVGNLSYDATDADLEALFSAHGTVAEASVVTQAGSQRSKGFAFVVMGSVEEAKAAAIALNDHELQGRKILVTGAKSEGRTDDSSPRRSSSRTEGREGREDREGRSERGESSSGRERKPRSSRTRGASDEIEKPTRGVRPLVIETVTSPTLSIAGLNPEASETDVTDLFAGIGTVVRREDTGTSDGGRSLRIDLADTAEAQKAVELLDGKSFMGRQIRVTGAVADSQG
ncbi:MAG TPA: RNA-binding protein [Bacteroidia bacterium]|nr:RNA-binding protein [Bacteroidia bacterium]